MPALQERILSTVRAAVIAGLAMVPLSASAQNPFRAVAHVDDSVVTQYDLDQRVALLDYLNTAGNLEKEALKRLVNERLQMAAASRAGVHPSEDAIKAAVDEFAGRAGISGDEFLAGLAAAGVDPQGFRAFITAGVAWRDHVRALFTDKSTASEAEIDRAIELEGTRGSARVLFSEIFLPTNTPNNAALAAELAPAIADLRTFEEFADAARRFSAGASRERGGRVPNWVDVANLPPAIREALMSLRPGQITQPIEIPNALAIFQLRAFDEAPATPPRDPVAEYATLAVPGADTSAGRARLDRIAATVRTCPDLAAASADLPETAFSTDKRPVSQIAADVALELARLDAGEMSMALGSADGTSVLVVMLCQRQAEPDVTPDRAAIAARLRNERLTLLADNYLEELRAAATITFP